jgi:hypothetical protein
MKTPGMKRGSALLLQVAIVLLGFAALGFLLVEPHLEGRNAHAPPFEIYFHDPFLAYVYTGSVFYFVALQRAFALFGEVRRSGSFSTETVVGLRTIQRCALILLGFVGGGVLIILAFGDGEDRPAGIFMSFLAASVAGGIAIAAARFARHLQRTVAVR